MTGFGLRNLGAAKLSAAQVVELRRLYQEEGWTQGRLARHFQVGVGQVGRIVRGEAWVTVTQTSPVRSMESVKETLIRAQADAVRAGVTKREDTGVLAERMPESPLDEEEKE